MDEMEVFIHLTKKIMVLEKQVCNLQLRLSNHEEVAEMIDDKAETDTYTKNPFEG